MKSDMFINKNKDGKNNICGKNIAAIRTSMGLSQRQLSNLLQMNGLDIDKNAIQRIEAGKRFVTDIELHCFSRTLGKTLDELLEID